MTTVLYKSSISWFPPHHIIPAFIAAQMIRSCSHAKFLVSIYFPLSDTSGFLGILRAFIPFSCILPFRTFSSNATKFLSLLNAIKASEIFAVESFAHHMNCHPFCNQKHKGTSTLDLTVTVTMSQKAEDFVLTTKRPGGRLFVGYVGIR